MGLHYDDLTEIWSRFVELVEVSNREYCFCLAGTVTSESPMNVQVSEEEKVDMSFLDRVPRQRRSSLIYNRRCKKAKVDVKTPVWLDEVMAELEGGASDPKLIFEKTLYQTDVDPDQSRLSLPFNKLIRSDFLTPIESRIIEQDIENNQKKKTGDKKKVKTNNQKTGVGAIVVDQRSEKWGVMLKRWELKKKSGKGSWSYALNVGWNDIVEANGFKVGDRFSIWSFRWRGVLCFALVPPPPPPPSGQNNSSIAQ